MNIAKAFKSSLSAGAIFIAALTLASHKLPAKTPAAEQEIRTMMERFSDILNNNPSPAMIGNFLESALSNQAAITLEVMQAGTEAERPVKSILDKADYISGYSYRPRMIKDYAVSIQVENFETLTDSKGWASKITFIESGAAQRTASLRSGKAFTSFTTCDGIYNYDQNKTLVLEKAFCRTEIFTERGV
ncbi:MAG: hypothetical protein ACLFR0_00795 [Alphaproteobacteria bacterium]